MGQLAIPSGADTATRIALQKLSARLTGNLTPGSLLYFDEGNLISANPLTGWIAGTANQISVANDGDGTVTLSTPQDIHTGASPSFAGLTLADLATYDSGHSEFTDSHQIVDKEYVDNAVSAINANFYMLDTELSGISDYKDTSLSIPSDTEANVALEITADDTYIKGWISPAAPFVATLIAGIYNLYLEAKVNATAGTKRIKLYWKLVEYKADTSETVIATSEESDELTSTQTDYNIHITLPSDYVLTAGSRVVCKIYASLSGSGGNPTTTIYYLGSINSRWSIPSSTEVLTDMFVPYSGAVSDVDLGSYDLTATIMNIVDTNTYISKDGSNNMTFTDAVVGTRTLKQLGCPTYKYIKAVTQSEGDLHLSDGTNWAVSKALIKYIRIVTSSTDWDLYILQNDNGYATNDAAIPMIKIGDAIDGDANLYLDLPYEDEDGTDEVHLYWIDNSGANTADIYIAAYELI